MSEKEINEYKKREEFLQRQVAFMAGFGRTGEGTQIFKELISTEISDADRERILEIIDEHILRLQQLKELCSKLNKQREASEK